MSDTPFRCAKCGAIAKDRIKTCDCATMVGSRRVNGKTERIWLITPEPADAMREALEPFAIAYDNAVISGCPPTEFVGAKEFEAARRALSQSTSAGRVGE